MSATLTLSQTAPTGTVYIDEHAGAYLDDEEVDIERETILIQYQDCSKGLGIKIVGGCSVDGEEDYGIFVKRVLPGGLAEIEGQLQSGDQILEVNGDSLEGVTNDRAVAILRKSSASNYVELLVSRDEVAREEFKDVIERQNFISHNCTPVVSSKTSSRCTTPSITDVKISPRLDSPHHTPVQTNGLQPDHTDQAGMVHTQGETTPAMGTQHVMSHLDRFGSKIQPDMASTPQGVKRRELPLYNYNQSVLTGSQNISPVLPSPRQQGPPLGNSSNPNGSAVLPRSQDMSQTRKLSLDPHVRLKVEKLEDALRYLGLDPTAEQQTTLRHNLHVDSSGTVSYGDFVTEAREIFRLQLDEQNLGPGAMLFAAQDLTSLLEPPPFKPELSTIPDVSVNEDIDTLRMERDDLKKEVNRLKALLKEKEESCNMAEDEVLRIRRQAQGAIHETRSLRSKVHLAEQAQRAARNMEQDYEEVVKLLEKEIADMKVELDKKQENPSADMEKRLAVVSCQLRKSELAKKTYEVATEKLLQFVEHVHETVKNEEGHGPKRLESAHSGLGESSKGTRPPGALGKHKLPGTRKLASEAREVVKAIKSLTDTQDLPYGWEEAYTEDGMRYYINHFNQMTTWSHPVSNVHHLPTIQGSEVTEQKAEQKREGKVHSAPSQGPST